MTTESTTGEEVFPGNANEDDSSNPPRDTKNLYKNLKLFSLSAVSFAIPVIYFLQANELKKNEHERSDLMINNYKLELRLKNDSDTNIQLAKIKANKTYEDHLIELLKPMINTADDAPASADTKSELKDISARLGSIADDVAALKKDNPVISTIKTELDAQQATIGSLIETTNKISNNLDGLISFIKINLSKNNSVTFGRIEQYRKRLSGLRSDFDILKANTNGKTKRVQALENQIIIDIAQKNLDSLTNDINDIYNKFQSP